ncbi:uncharacterized protein LOC144113094 [Amblyomma americanum]
MCAACNRPRRAAARVPASSMQPSSSHGRGPSWAALLLLLLACVHESEQGKWLKLAGAAALLGGGRGIIPIPIPIHYGRDDHHHHHHHPHHYHHHHHPTYHHHHGHGHYGGHGGYGGWW